MTHRRSRNFRLGLTLGVGSALAAWGLLETGLHATWVPADPASVAIVKTYYYSPTDAQIQTMVRQAVALAGGLDGIVSPGDDVVIKPNCVSTVWAKGSGVVTNCEVTREVVRMCQDLDAGQVRIAVGTAGYRDDEETDRFYSQKAFHDSGYDLDWNLVDDATGAGFIDLNDAGGTYPGYPEYTGSYDDAFVDEIVLPDYWLTDTYWIVDAVHNCDVYIDVPALKNHELAGSTISLKSHVGVAPSDIYHLPGTNTHKWSLVHRVAAFPQYAERELNARAIVDLNQCRPTHFVVVDGLVGITNGPVGGTKANPPVRCVLAGADPVAVDTIGTLVMGYDPASIISIELAAAAGLGTNDVSRIRVVGDSVYDVRKDFPNGYGDAQRADFYRPEFTGFTPASGETLYGSVSVVPFGLYDNIGIVKAEMYVDGEAAGGTNVTPFNMDWDTTGVPDGDHDVAVCVYDGALNDFSLTHTLTVDNIIQSSQPLPVGWNLVGVPALAAGSDAADVFDQAVAAGNTLQNNLWTFDQTTGYSPYSSGWQAVESGRGYWLWLTQPATEDCEGLRGLADADIPLDQGWSLLGYPFTQEGPWADCTVSDGAETKTVGEAEIAGWLQATIYYYAAAGYLTTTPGAGDDPQLRPWRAYWLLAYREGLTLTVPLP